MRVRALTEDDLDRIKVIDRVAFSAEEQYADDIYRQMLQSGLSVVALDETGTVVGYAFVQSIPYTHVRSLAVHPDFRRRGFAKALLEAVIANASDRVDLLVDEANGPAVALYRTFGFEFAEIAPTVPPKRRMTLELKPLSL